MMIPKTPSAMNGILLILGGAVFGVLGALHAIYTLLDLRNPRRLVPVDPSVAARDGQFRPQTVARRDGHVASLDRL